MSILIQMNKAGLAAGLGGGTQVEEWAGAGKEARKTNPYALQQGKKKKPQVVNGEPVKTINPGTETGKKACHIYSYFITTVVWGGAPVNPLYY